MLVPDVNRSLAEFTPDFTAGEGAIGTSGDSPGAITFGLAAVRNVGEALVALIVAEREARAVRRLLRLLPAGRSPGPEQADHRVADQGRRLRLDGPRPPGTVPHVRGDRRPHPRAAPRARCRRHVPVRHPGGARDEGKTTGFADTRIPIPDTEFDKSLRLAFEKEMLGLYISDHPLMGLEGSLSRLTDCSLAELRDYDPEAMAGSGYEGNGGGVKVIGGVITELQRRYTKKGDLMATFVLEDLNASIEAFVFPKTMADYGALLDDDAIVVVKARLDMRDERLKLVCMEVSRPELVADGLRDLRISLPLGTLTDRTVDDLKRLLSEHPGHSPRPAPRGREGAAPAVRVQRGLPAADSWANSGSCWAHGPSRPDGPSDLRGRRGCTTSPVRRSPWSEARTVDGGRIRQAPENPVKSVDGTWRGRSGTLPLPCGGTFRGPRPTRCGGWRRREIEEYGTTHVHPGGDQGLHVDQ